MARAKVLFFSLACAVGLALAPSALTAPNALATGASAKPVFHPRIGPALGLWTLIDANGDTRTVVSHFIEER